MSTLEPRRPILYSPATAPGDEAFCILQVIFERDRTPVDFRYLETNESFEDYTGISGARGKLGSEVMAGLDRRWLEFYAEVARTGSSARRLERAENDGRWFDVQAFRIGAPAEHKVAVLFHDITDHKRTEAILARVAADAERQQRLYEAIISSTPDLAYVFDLDYRFIFANEALLEMWGRTLEESIGRRLLEVGYEPWHAEMHEREIDQVAANKKPLRGVVSFPHAVLGERNYDYIFVPVLDDEGNVEAVAGTTRDITELTRRQRELQAEQARLIDVFDHAPSLMCILRGPDHVFDRVNKMYLELVGNRDLVGKTVREALPEVEGQGFAELLDQVYEAGVPYVGTQMPVRLHRNPQSGEDGLEVRYLDFVYQPIRGPDGSVDGIFVQGVDLTQRVRAEAGQRESEARYSALIGQIKDYAIFSVDREGRITSWNEGCERVLGYARDEFIGMDGAELFPPRDRATDVPRRELTAAMRQGSASNDRWMLAKGERSFFAFGVTTALYDAEGMLLGFSKVMRDQTEWKRAQEARDVAEYKLRELSRSLERRVAERTTELEEQTLRLRRLASDLTSAEQRERKRLASLLHDDLQQLLVAAEIQLGAVGRQLSDESGKRAVAQATEWIQEAAGAARRLTRQLRPPALYEDGLVSALRWLASEMKERHRLEVDIVSNDAPAPLGDDLKALLFESVRETLFNVVKHAKVSRAEVEIRHQPDRVCIAVIDRGRGFVAEDALKVRDDGGFGLFRIRERIAALGGRHAIESSPGHGTRIEMEVPLDPIEEAQAHVAEAASHFRSSSGQDALESVLLGEKTRVLVVDDHTIVREGIANILRTDPRLLVVDEAIDGIGAIEAVERQRPEVVLMDINMPRMNGIEATREIRRRWPETRVIGLSVQDDDVTAQAMFDAGAESFISKSGDSGRIIATVLGLSGSQQKE